MSSRYVFILALAASLIGLQVGPGVQMAEATRIDHLRERTGAPMSRVDAIAKRIQARAQLSFASFSTANAESEESSGVATRGQVEEDETKPEGNELKAEAPVPEPSAALVFGMGLLLAHRATRNRR